MTKRILFFIVFSFIVILSCTIDIDRLTTFYGEQSNYETKSRTVLDNFILGFDTYESVDKKISIPIYETIFSGYDTIKRVEMMYNIKKKYDGKIVLAFINDKLYGIRYFPKENLVNKYMLRLNMRYESDSLYEWYNDRIIILYRLDDDFTESFIHYDRKMFYKYTD